MNKELLEEAEGLWQRREKAYRFASIFNVYPMREGIKLVDEFSNLAEMIPVTDALTEEDLLNRELRRRITQEALALDHQLSGGYYTFNDVVSLFGIPSEDLTGLRSFLDGKKQEVESVIHNAYMKTEVEGYRISLPTDIPRVSGEAEGFCTTQITNYHEKLGKLFRGLSDVGEYLRDIRSEPTTNPRSYFNQQTNTLALGMAAICYQAEDRTLHINERELIKLFGHEGMGHGLNFVITRNSKLPFFLKEESMSTTATLESVAQHFEREIFKDLQRSPKTQRDLGISREFTDIYEEEKEIQIISEYQLRFFQYAITVLADLSIGLPQDLETIKKKIELLSELALYPGQAVGIIENNKNNFDSQGNLNPTLVSELKYCAQPVKRVLDIFIQKGLEYSNEGRNIIDKVLLKGFWTPIGMVENARYLVSQI